jgi:hypothetical protein
MEVLVPPGQVHAVVSWFEKSGMHKEHSNYLTSASRCVRITPLPIELTFSNTAGILADTCDQTFLSKTGLTVAYPLATFENLNLCSSAEPMQLFENIARRKQWAETGLPVLKVGRHLCSVHTFSHATTPDSIRKPEIIPLHLLGLNNNVNTHVQ